MCWEGQREKGARLKIKTTRSPSQISRAAPRRYRLSFSFSSDGSSKISAWTQQKCRLGSGLQIHLPPNCCTHKTSPSLHPPTCCDHSLSAIIWSPKCHRMYQDRIEFLIEPGQMEVIKALQIKSIPHLHEKATHDATKKCACSIQINTMETIESKMRHSIRFIFLLAEPIVTSNECAD